MFDVYNLDYSASTDFAGERCSFCHRVCLRYGNRGKQTAILISLLVIFSAASAGIWFAIGVLIWATYFLSLTLGAVIGAIVLFILDETRLA